MKMHAKVSNLENICRQIPRHSSSFVPNLPQQGGFNLSHQYVRNQVGLSTDWRKHPKISCSRELIRSKITAIFSSRIHYEQQQAFHIATILEYWLFIDAASEEEYMNQDTLIQRLQTQVDKLHGAKYSQQVDSSITSTSKMVPSSGLLHAWSNGSLAEPTFQKLAGPVINSTDYCTLTVNNKYGFPKGGISHPSIVHEPVYSPDDCSSITTCTDMDVFSNFSASGGARNLETSSKSISSQFPQQHADDLETNMIKYRDCLGTNQKNESMAFLTTMGKSPQSESLNLLIPQHVSRDISEVSNLFPSMSSSCENSSLGDLLQYQPQKLDFQQNFKHVKKPYEHRSSASMSQSSSCLVDQGEHCCQMLRQKTLKQPQLPKKFLNGDEQFASESSAGLFGLDGAACVNSCNSSEVSIEQRILLAYFHYKNLNNVPGDNQISFIKYLHSTVCSNGMCTCERHIKLLLHFDKCQSDDCHLCRPWKSLHVTGNLQPHLEFTNSMIIDSTVRDNDGPSGNSEALLPPTKRLKMEPDFGVSLINNASSDLWTPRMVQPYTSEGHSELQQQPESPLSIYSEVTESNMEQFTNPMLDSMSISEIKNSVIDDSFRQPFKSETIPSEGLEADHIFEGPLPKSHHVIASSNLKDNVIISNSKKGTLCKDSSASDIEVIQGRTGFNQAGENGTKKVTEPKADQEKETKSSNTTVNGVSLTEFFTYNQIREHIMSLRKQFGQSTTEEERGIAVNSCQLCAMAKLFFAPVPIYCLSCGIRIKRNANYYYRRAEECDTQHCFCTSCYRNSRGGYIMFNGLSVSKPLLDKKRNDDVTEESWVQCDKCEGWQHQICALFNNKRNLEGSAEYICPRCCLKEIENGMRVPSPKTANFGAKDLPRTKLSDHIEQRLFKHLMQERAERERVEGNKNLDEVLAAENLSVRVVLSVGKQLKVKKQFLDIFLEENYPAEFPYRSKVILLFQMIEGVDVCLFGMYVQEFGSECGYPNQRCVYISYLDSVKYFRPQRETVTGEALRTFVYHEMLIGYLDFCKKRGFTTCYIWACPPVKGEDYVLYCHPDNQKTPKSDKLRHWYHSMLRKAAEENIVVGFTNLYDHFFVPTGKCDSKVTAARLPYFDGDYWSGAAMDLVRKIEQESGGEYERMLKKLVTKRTLKAMGHTNPSEGTAKDILVMQRLGQTILPVKEDFIIVHLQYTCVHCHEVIVSGKRWFCSECKKFQECERCHTADSHTSISGEKHTLCQVLVVDIPFDTKENDIILDNGLFENRHKFLSFCQKNQFQFDTLRRAKHSSMMILYHLKDPTLLTVGTICGICYKHNVFQQIWQCEICPELTVCSVCYKERGANCHVHKLSQSSSTALCRTGNQELQRKSVLMQELLEVLQHASQCHSTKTQPCSYPNCLQIKKLFSHASRCTVRASGGCQHCKKAWLGLTVHSRNCRDSQCCIPRCMDLKKHAEWISMQSESRRRAAVVESNRAR